MTEEQILMIERMGATGFTLEEVELVVEESAENNETFLKAYRKGFLLALLQLRERIFKDANNGSSPAQNMAKQILDNAITKNGGEI